MSVDVEFFKIAAFVVFIVTIIVSGYIALRHR